VFINQWQAEKLIGLKIIELIQYIKEDD